MRHSCGRVFLLLVLISVPSLGRDIPIQVIEGLTEIAGELSLEHPEEARFSTDGDWRVWRRKFPISKMAQTRARMVPIYGLNGEPNPVTIPQIRGGKTVLVRAMSLGRLRVKRDVQASSGWVLEEQFSYDYMSYLPPSETGLRRYFFESELHRVWVNIEGVKLAGDPDDVLIAVANGHPSVARVVARGRDGHDYVVLYSPLTDLKPTDNDVPILRVRRGWLMEPAKPLEPDLYPQGNLSEALSSLSIGNMSVSGATAWGQIFESAYHHVVHLSGRTDAAQCGPILTHTIL